MESLAEKCDLRFVTFLFCVHLDCEEKWKKLELVLHFFNKCLNTNIMIYEFGLNRKIPLCYHSESVKIKFIESSYFDRPKYLNIMISSVKTSVVAIWNYDLIPIPRQIFSSASKVLKSNIHFSYPFSELIYTVNGQLIKVLIDSNDEIGIIKQNERMLDKELSYYRNKEVVLINKLNYEKCGLENKTIEDPSLSGWEREKRLEIMGLKKYVEDGILIQINSNLDLYKKNKMHFNIKELRELFRICKMNRYELQQEIKIWRGNKKK